MYRLTSRTLTTPFLQTIGSSIDGHLATIIVGTVQLVSNVVSLLFVDKSGRKPLLIASGIIMCISNASMGVAFYLNTQGHSSFGYLPLVSLIVFMVGFSIGFGCIPFLLMGEILPSPQRSLLSSIAGSVNLGIMFMVIKTYHPLEEVSYLSERKTFNLFGTISGDINCWNVLALFHTLCSGSILCYWLCARNERKRLRQHIKIVS